MKAALTFTALGFAAASAMALSSVASVSPPPLRTSPVIGPGKPFVDDLSGLDQAIWSVSDGWSNGAYMVNDWRKTQTRFGKGLVLALEDRPGGISRYASGEVQSRDTFGHGYYEATMQAASGSGIISGFFTYTGPPFGKPWNEIDVEILGKNTREATLSYYYNGKSLSHVVALDFDAASGLHHYAFDWQPDYIRWYIDGRLVHEAVGSDLPLPNVSQKIMMHLWGTDSIKEWAGPFDARAIPTSMRFGCIAYSHSRPETDKCRGG
jgi:endo-1,3-1,4-beta-glycanase ExoK